MMASCEQNSFICGIILVLILYRFYIIHAWNCVTVKGSDSGSTQGARSTAICPSNYDIVSCGIQIIQAGASNTHGQYIFTNNNTCSTINPIDAANTIVYARCCNFQSLSISCTQYTSLASAPGDNQISSISCQNPTETLFGCNTYTYPGYRIDGGWPGSDHQDNNGMTTSSTNNECTSRSGWGSTTQESTGVYTSAICCDSSDIKVDIQCVAMWGPTTTQGVQYEWSNVSCPSTYPIMTSCQPATWFQNWDSAYVNDDNECNIQQLDLTPTIRITAAAIWYEITIVYLSI